MPKKNNKLPADIVDHWPEIFDDIEIKTIPLEYIKEINVQFHDGKIWQLDVDQRKITDSNVQDIERSLESFFEEYDEFIDSVDFNLDTNKVKEDISRRTKRFMKKRK